MAETMSVDEIVGELREMIEVSLRNPTTLRRLLGNSIVIQYQFVRPGGDVVPYVLTVADGRGGVEPGEVPEQDADLVIRTEPITQHRITSGELGGREAVVSGMLDIRKAPSMPKLVFLRSMFNQYKKARLRADPPDGDGCAVETSGRLGRRGKGGTE
ncbi:hypothetical protein B0I33_107211 [Prauserella shujinwangii]|uniref:SCP-2 sterol transfer family protein n=1 Tax=Prauserella shujinwangii TaxID=1453103 RepID=A0A2T0LSK9_9PSEU|nr:hypothetical protein [Prauserella shujinwangii]PRX46634.1 hypothetical protein B0I33_107211 [Prauserella shujinwangii]